ncbi:hypothetical protein C478_01550 [Natrinema thermotolerans DSM 11552]|nr:hypothetical protein C478_01550 [Natrinema thermotolerans DSM 11552]
MRSLTALGIGLILIGGIVLAAPSGAFDLTSADRGVGVETASDEDALVGIEKEPISLTENDATRLVWSSGLKYEYTDVELVTITDRTQSSDLEVTDAGLNMSTGDTDYPDLQEDEIVMANGEFTVEGTLRCDARIVGFLQFDQQSSSTNLTMDLETSDGTITVELEREIPVQCK